MWLFLAANKFRGVPLLPCQPSVSWDFVQGAVMMNRYMVSLFVLNSTQETGHGFVPKPLPVSCTQWDQRWLVSVHEGGAFSNSSFAHFCNGVSWTTTCMNLIRSVATLWCKRCQVWYVMSSKLFWNNYETVLGMSLRFVGVIGLDLPDGRSSCSALFLMIG